MCVILANQNLQVEPLAHRVSYIDIETLLCTVSVNPSI